MDTDLWHDRLAINLQNLHLDVAEHAVFYAEIASEGAELKAVAARWKINLDIARAEASAEIRANPAQFGLEKTTEAAIQAALTTHADVLKAQDAYLDAQSEYDEVSAIVTAFEHRRSMLNNEVQLHGADYWGTTQCASVDPNELREEQIEKIIERRKKSD